VFDTGASLDAPIVARSDGGSPDGRLEADAPLAEDAAPDAPPIDASPDAPPSANVGALSFDGVADWVNLPAAAGGASETAFTVELWFRAASDTGNMFEVYNSGASADRFLSLNGGAVCFYVYGSYIAQPCTTATTYADGAWHHAAGTLGTGGTNLYVDGSLAGTIKAVTSSAFSTDTDIRLGKGHTAYGNTIVYFQGDLDEVRVWSVERSAQDIAASYGSTIDPTTAGLQGYWRLDESGAASVAPDATSGAHDGQLTSFTFAPSPWISPGAF
jgi:hypothetical protein